MTTKRQSPQSTKPPADRSSGSGELFQSLRRILERYAPRLDVKTDNPAHYYLNSKKLQKGKEQFFGAVAIRKAYVAYYLHGIFLHPELMKGASPALVKCHPGKSCFNFKKNEPAVLAELEALTQRAFEQYEKDGLV